MNNTKNNLNVKKRLTRTPSFVLSKKCNTVGSKKKKNLVCGFTLIEMLISITLFSVVVVMAIGVIVTILDANKHVRSTSIAMGNINVVLEKMFREVSAGSSYHCGEGGNISKAHDCPAGNPLTALIFENVSGDDANPNDQNIYRINSSESSLELSRDGGANYERLTDENIIIDDFRVNVVGNLDDAKQPSVFISIRGYIKKKEDDQVMFAIQTMMSERLDPSILR